MNIANPAYTYKAISASGNVCPGDGILGGIFVGAASATPLIAVYDDPGTGTSMPIVPPFVPELGWNAMPFAFSKGLNVVISGTVAATVGYISG